MSVTKVDAGEHKTIKKIDPNTGEEVKIDTKIYCEDEHLTQQSAKDECDMNLIVAAAKRGADIKHVTTRQPMYGDFTNLPDYREALTIVNQARDAFMGLDAFVRERFGNDPARMLDFLSDDKNREEAIKLGLVKAPEPPKVDEHLETLKSIDRSVKSNSGSKKSKAEPADD